MENNNLKEVYSAEKMYRIEIMKNLLSKNGIQSEVINKKSSSFPVGEIQLMVNEKDFQKAKKIIDDHQM